MHENEESSLSAYRFYNHFVSLKGQLSGFRSSLQLKIDEIDIIGKEEEPTEEMIWWTEVKSQWERLAASARSSGARSPSNASCPCLCHSGNCIPCRCLGDSMVRPATFNRAVAVISTALRIASPSRVSMTDLVELTKSCASASTSLHNLKCLADCATVEAVRQLSRHGFVTRDNSGKFTIFSSRLSEPIRSDASNEYLPRYPLTQSLDSTQSLTQPTERVAKSEAKFFSASQAFYDNRNISN